MEPNSKVQGGNLYWNSSGKLEEEGIGLLIHSAYDTFRIFFRVGSF